MRNKLVFLHHDGEKSAGQLQKILNSKKQKVFAINAGWLAGRTCATSQFSPVMTGENKHDDCSKLSPIPKKIR
ncbi:MAG: hypothetical protein WC604_01745 [Candidatus Gracilibacteria bacterium]